MNAFTRFGAAALVSLGFGTAAAAEQTGPRITGYGVDTTLAAPTTGTVFGGALTRVVGSGESATVELIEAQHMQAGRVARVVGSGENQEIIYQDPMPVRVAGGGQQG